MTAVLALGALATLRRDDPGTAGDAVARASHAVGVSSGAGFRGIVSVDLDAFRRGLEDGLAGEAKEPAVMSRAERFARIRDVMQRLSDAEVEAVAARIDQGRDS